jgi:anti-sigma B factor antagonist
MPTRIRTQEIDPASARDFRAEVDAALADGADADGVVVLDFTDVTFIDSTGLSVLVDAHRTLVDQQRTLRVENARPTIVRVFSVTGLEQFLGT